MPKTNSARKRIPKKLLSGRGLCREIGIAHNLLPELVEDEIITPEFDIIRGERRLWRFDLEKVRRQLKEASTR